MRGQRRPLLLTADADLLDDLLGMAASVGVAVDVAVEPSICHPQWTDAPLVLVGADVVTAWTAAGLGSRAAVLVVARGAPPEGLAEAAARLGAERVLGLPTAEAALLDRLADVAEPAGPARVLAVVPGRGGAGASVLATALALTAADAAPSWLVDLDPLGGGADVGMGAELSSGARWADFSVLTGRLSPTALRAALPTVLGVTVVAADTRSEDDPTAEAVRAVLSAARRDAGAVVLDLTRHRTTAREEALSVADELYVVVPGEVRAVMATRQLVHRLQPTRARLRAVVRPVPEGLSASQVADALALPCAGALEDEPSVRAALLTGDPGGLIRGTALGTLCRRLLDGAGSRRVAA